MSRLSFAVVSLCVIAMAPLAQAEPTAREIMQQVNDRPDGDNATADIEMILIDKQGDERRRQLRAFSKDYEQDTRQVIFILAPADTKGTSFLTYDYESFGTDDDQWLYLPALGKVKRLASADKSGSFLGSDFSYADLTQLQLDQYDFELMKEAEVRGKKVWQISAMPKSESEVERTGYSKSVFFVLQDSYFVVRAANWIANSEDIKYLDVTRLEQIDGIWVGMERQMTTKRGGETLHKTILRTSQIVFDQDLPDATFTTRQLAKGP